MITTSQQVMDKFECKKCGGILKLTGRGWMICPDCKMKHFLGRDGRIYLSDIEASKGLLKEVK